jgi:hypothetical protein
VSFLSRQPQRNDGLARYFPKHGTQSVFYKLVNKELLELFGIVRVDLRLASTDAASPVKKHVQRECSEILCPEESVRPSIGTPFVSSSHVA